MRIVSFAPLPAAPSGIADYAETLVAAMRDHAPISISTSSIPTAGHQIERSGNKSYADHPGDVALYHLGNNQLHSAIYERALVHPGVVVLHDAVLTHFLLGTLGEGAWIEEFVYNYGEWSRGLAQELWKNRARSGSDPRYFEYPMLKRIVEASRTIIVHNPAAACAVLRHHPKARVIEIPHFFDQPNFKQPSFERTVDESLANASGQSGQPLRIGVFGYLRESKRIPSILRALDRATQRGQLRFELILAGSFASSDLERSLRHELAQRSNVPKVTYTGHLSVPDFWEQARAVDVCVNLRYPTAHETSGIGVRLMGIGKPVIFTSGGELTRIPEDACLRVDHGPHEEEMLAEYLTWLAGNRDAGREIGSIAAAYIAREHALDKIAKRFWDTLLTSMEDPTDDFKTR